MWRAPLPRGERQGGDGVNQELQWGDLHITILDRNIRTCKGEEKLLLTKSFVGWSVGFWIFKPQIRVKMLCIAL